MKIINGINVHTILFYVLFLDGVCITALAQSQKIIPPTPNAMKMTEYQSQRPNMYTGTANISIPLYTIEFDGWQLPLSISYNATGIRPNEEASEVGLGWSLNSTGVISRVSRGLDDLNNTPTGRKGYVYDTHELTFNSGYKPLVDLSPPQGSYYNHLASTNPDTQPDTFNYNFFGYSGSFVLTQRVINGKIEVKPITRNACKIFYFESTSTFRIITPEGFKGDFTIKERSTSFSGNPTSYEVANGNGWGENYIDIAKVKNDGAFRVVSAWYLSKITSPRNQVLSFTYDLNQDGSSKYLSGSRSYSEVPEITVTPTAMQTVHEHVYLKDIQSDELKVDFIMEPREDIRRNTLFITPTHFPQGELLKRYKEIIVSGKDAASTLNKKIVLKQSYFNQHKQDLISGNQTEHELLWLRSRLDRISIDDQEYRFYYEKGAKGLPSKLTFGIDHFGFYNGREDNGILLLPPGPPPSTAFIGSSNNLSDSTIVEIYQQQPGRWADFANGKAGLLTKVRYPTRGYTILEYEPHTYLPISSGYFYEQPGAKVAGGARISKMSEYDFNDSLKLTRIYKYQENPADPYSATTGKLMTPLYNRYSRIYRGDNQTSIKFERRSHSSIPGNNAAEGKIIGYSKVHEIVSGEGESLRTTYYFENRSNTILPYNSVAIGYPNLNGQLKEMRNYDKQGNVLLRTENLDLYHKIDSIKAISFEPLIENNGLYIDAYAPYYIQCTFVTPYKVITTQLSQQSSTSEDSNGGITYNGLKQISEKKLSYNKNYLLSFERSTNSIGDSIITSYKRPGDYLNPSPVVAFMANDSNNIVNPVIEEIRYKGAIVTYAAATKYVFNSNQTRADVSTMFEYDPNLGSLPSNSDGNSFASPYVKVTEFDRYDQNNGKLLQYTGRDGIVNSFIWGYNNKLPIVHGVGVDHSSLLSAYNNALLTPSTFESSLRANPLLVGKAISTYEHNPLVGVKQLYNQNSSKKSFEYDQFGRLRLARDDKNNIVGLNQYNFRKMADSRILTASTQSLNFGSFYSCSLPSYKTLTLFNRGEDDLSITSIVVPTGFTSSWYGGVIPAGNQVDMQISFSGAPGAFNGNLVVTSNSTNQTSPLSVALSATYNNQGTSRVLQLSQNSISFTTTFIPIPITITNTGNQCLSITGTSLPTNDPDWYVSVQRTTLAPNQSITLNAMMKTSNPSTPTRMITILSDKNAGNDQLELKKQ